MISHSMSFSVNYNAVNPGTDADSTALKSCSICERTFHPNSLERHESICAKIKKSIQRKPFNSFRQRAKEIQSLPVSVEKKEKGRKAQNKQECNSIHDGRSRNNFKELLNNGQSPKKVIPNGYQQCPTCERHFSEKAAERHISWCQEQKCRLPKTPPNTQALEKLKARVKYQAPLTTKKRLVKSADSVHNSSKICRKSSYLPPADSQRISFRETKNISMKQGKEAAKYLSNCASNNNNAPSTCTSNLNTQIFKNKKAVKFKDIFPVYNKERNNNLDMLSALRLRLSELSTSDEILEDFVSSSYEDQQTSRPGLHSEKMLDPWTSDGEARCTTSSSSEGSLPSSSAALGSKPPVPRFCYNCGSKYPIVSAKFCCECGAQRFVFGLKDYHPYIP